jgi:hypothetical protein
VTKEIEERAKRSESDDAARRLLGEKGGDPVHRRKIPGRRVLEPPRIRKTFQLLGEFVLAASIS